MKKLNTNRKVVIAIAVLLVLLAVGGSYYLLHRDDKYKDVDPITGGSINYGPPTKQETADIENEIKSDADAQSKYSGHEGKSVKPLIVAYGQTKAGVEVSARVPGIIEDGGDCTLTLVKGSAKVSASKKGVSNASDTSCGFIIVPNSKLSTGSWSATVSYASKNAAGISGPQAIEVK